LRNIVTALFMSISLTAPAVAACPPGNAIYTAADAARGAIAYNTNCASCHNSDMSGNSGPALAGPKFVSYLTFTKITAPQLNSFIVEQMPATAPGSLSKTQYDDIFAYILSYNHYPAGQTAIDDANLACVSLLPYPGPKQ
jgi:mono/diheme cytochrome c family protein